MSTVPTPYTPSFSFYDWNVANPNVPAPGQKWDVEYNNIKTLFDAMLARAALIQRDDGRLANASVGREQLSADFASGVLAPVPWEPLTAYGVDASVMYNGSWYWALVAHTSTGAFDGSKWQFVGTFFSDDPLTLSLGTDAFTDGAVTPVKMSNEARAGLANSFISFKGGGHNALFNLTFVGNVITGTFAGVGQTCPDAGDSLTFSGQTSTNAILNGTWKCLTSDGTTVTFEVVGTPAGALSQAQAFCHTIYASRNIEKVVEVSTGKFQLFFETPIASSNSGKKYIVAGSGINDDSRSALANLIVNRDAAAADSDSQFTIKISSSGDDGVHHAVSPSLIQLTVFAN